MKLKKTLCCVILLMVSGTSFARSHASHSHSHSHSHTQTIRNQMFLGGRHHGTKTCDFEEKNCCKDSMMANDQLSHFISINEEFKNW